MKIRGSGFILIYALAAFAAGSADEPGGRLANIRQLTSGGQNAEAYWSPDGKRLIFQSTRGDLKCDQIFIMNADGADQHMVSTGKGRTTCGYFLADSKHILYASTHLAGDACPPAADRSKGYVWAVYPGYDIFESKDDGTELKRLTDAAGYDAEATVNRKTGNVIYTSLASGDLDLWTMHPDGLAKKRITSSYGYDGGAVFSRDGKKIVWRANHPDTPETKRKYADFLSANLTSPMKMELFVADSDGSNARQITKFNCASFAPTFTPDGEHILFSSNKQDCDGRKFELYAINVDGSGLQQVTNFGGFTSFPEFSPDGKKLVFVSDWKASARYEFNVFTADWKQSDITAENYREHVNYLASPELKGRRTGTPELNRAADYIADQFHTAGLKPVNGSYFQEFQITAKTALGGDRLLLREGSKQIELRESADFVPLNLSTNGSANASVVFAGYGITAPEYHYDDYAGVDVRDKIVLVLRHEPQENDEKSVFDGTNPTSHSQLASKAVNAKLHGARAVLLVNDAPHHPGGEDDLDRFTPAMATEDYGLLIDQVSTKAADQLLAAANQTLSEVIRAIDKDTKPHSFPIAPATAELTTDLKEETRTVRNVVGFVPGESKEFVIVGAHYDHLGLGEQNSLAPALMGTIHPGADDNASGTAGAIELGRHFAAAGAGRRGVLFLCFAGEEEGLLGSAWFANHALKPLGDAVAMINMDMIGRIRDNKVYVGGIGTGSSFKQIVAKATAHAGFQSDESEAGGYGASDHTSFTVKQVPTLFFFSGLHSDYHKPSDTADKINAPDAVRLLDEIAEITTALADAPERPQFARVQPPAHSGSMGSSSAAGYGPYFGSIPDFGSTDKGVKFADVRDGSPAAQAGFKAGDVLVEFDGKPIQNLYDFTYALRARKPGDTVKARVLRDGKGIEAQVLLTKRN